MPADPRAAWSAKYAREPTPWRGPARFAPSIEAALSNLPRGARVLDLGAGGGKATAALLARGFRVVALDFARQGLASVDARAARVEASVAALPMRENAFQGVLARHVVGHVAMDVARGALREARRVLVPSGILLFEDLAAGDLREDRRDGGIPRRFFSDEDVRKLFADWRIASVERVVASKRYGERVRIAAVAFAERSAEPSTR